MWASEARPGSRLLHARGEGGGEEGLRGRWGGPPTGDPGMRPSAVMGKAERVTAGDETWGRPSLGGRKALPSGDPELRHLGN